MVFFFQAEDGIRDGRVTGVQTCALPIWKRKSYPEYLRDVSRHKIVLQLDRSHVPGQLAGDALLCRIPCVGGDGAIEIGRASCRERVWRWGVGASVKVDRGGWCVMACWRR